MNNKVFVLGITFIALSLAGWSQETQSKWQSKTMIPDGEKTDWESRPGYFNGETGILYEIRNDSQYVYLFLEIPDEHVQRRIIHTGLILSFKVKSKPKILGTLKMHGSGGANRNVQPGMPRDFELTKQEFLLANNYADADGFLQQNGPVKISNTDTSKISFGIGWDDKNDLGFEVRVPVTELFSAYTLTKDLSKKAITVGIQLPTPDFQAHQGPQMQAGMRPGGMRGQMGGSYSDDKIEYEGGENRQGPPPGMANRMGPQQFRFTIKLAAKPN